MGYVARGLSLFSDIHAGSMAHSAS